MTEETAAKTPEWMLLLENKKKRPHRLAHEIGAGAPCLSCGDSCPGLDLHFWRKLCRNCKCKKEEHDVKDDEGYEQFEILFASTGVGKKRCPGAFLDIKVPEASISTSSSTGSVANRKGAAEYMQQLPPSKLPISGSDGALYRRQQLESQIPLHDLDATKCHGLSADEIQGLQQYLENIKNNVVGQGRVMKLPMLYNEHRLTYSGPTRHQSTTTAQASFTGESRPIRIASSRSAQCLKSLPSFPLLRPYTAQHYDKDDPNSFPPPPPDLLPPVDLKTPSAFLPSSHQGVPTVAQTIVGQTSRDLVHSSQLPLNPSQNSAALARGEEYEHVPGRYHGDVKPQTYARDGTFVSDQHAPDIAYSTQMPVGLVSQQSRHLGLSKAGSKEMGANESGEDVIQGSKHPGSRPQDGKFYTNQNPQDVLYSTMAPSSKPKFSSIQHGSALPDDRTTSDAHSSVHGEQPPIESVHLQSELPVPFFSGVAHSAPIAGDSMPKAAQVLHQSHLVQQQEWEPNSLENELSGKLEKVVGLGDGAQAHEEYHLKCHKCNDTLKSGQVAVLAERAENQTAWHPQCFVCCTCDLIFVKEYTCAEEKAFHVKHFCCYECDVPLGGKQYIPKDNQPICLQCFENKYGKSCHTCKQKIAPGDQRVGWTNLSWHVSPACFRCSRCLKSLLGGKFLVKNEQPFCSKECTQFI
ncbi:hypothetical protein C0J52_00029 [Blattella germanica]|nr:hypothetical protein C0J52_00029 [Blattella germanica]